MKVFSLVLLLLLPAFPAMAQVKDVPSTMAQVVRVDSIGHLRTVCQQFGLKPENMVFYAPNSNGPLVLVFNSRPGFVLTLYALDNKGRRMEPFILQHHFSGDSSLLLQTDFTEKLDICVANRFYQQSCWQPRLQDGVLALDQGFVELP